VSQLLDSLEIHSWPVIPHHLKVRRDVRACRKVGAIERLMRLCQVADWVRPGQTFAVNDEEVQTALVASNERVPRDKVPERQRQRQLAAQVFHVVPSGT